MLATYEAEYFLGAQGESCTAACARLGHQFCDAGMDLGDDTEAMLRHLNISDCWRNASTPHAVIERVTPFSPPGVVHAGVAQKLSIFKKPRTKPPGPF